MDNRQFNVNGAGKEMLRRALTLAFRQRGSGTKAKAYLVDKNKGLVLLWTTSAGSSALLTPLDAAATTAMVWAWLQSEPEVACTDWDADADHAGHNSLGWRVYCENWGHVDLGGPDSSKPESHYAIVAVKPAYLWHGK